MNDWVSPCVSSFGSVPMKISVATSSDSDLTAGYMSIRDNFWPLTSNPNVDMHVQGYVLSISTALMMVCCLIIMVSAARRWVQVLTGRVPQLELAEA